MAGRTVLFAVLIVCCWPWSVYTQDTGGVRFSLNGTTYPNNSLVTLEDISGGDSALLCLTDLTACCRSPYTGYWGPSIGNWFFPNGTRVPSPGSPWELYRSRGQMVVLLNRRRGGEDGIYRCEIPDTMNVNQTIYIGVYTASRGFPFVTYLRYDSQSNTLTCTSTGGPATTVTWRRDGAVITINATHQQTKRVVDPVMGIYQTVLTISPSVSQSDIAGYYSCTVENVRGRSSRIVLISGNGEGVRFSLRGITYQNNSIVTLEDIGEWDYALFCVTDQPVCCRHPYTPTLGNWFFPNGTRLLSSFWTQWNFYRDRGQMLVNMHRRRGGVTGIYRCVIPDAMNVTQTIYIGVYTANSGFPWATYLRYDIQSRTLTCYSYGGPATTVKWRRDGVLITPNATYQQTKRVIDPVQGVYHTVLTINSSVSQSDIAGIYYCTVENTRGRSSGIAVIPGNEWRLRLRTRRIEDDGRTSPDGWKTVNCSTKGKGVRFSLRSAIFQNNSLVSLEDIGEWGDALLCVTDLTACCPPPYTGIIRSLLGNWFFPNGTRLRYFYPNYTSDTQWDFFRSRGHVIVYMHRRRGGVNGIYRCEIPDAMNVTQTMYIGVYTASTGQVTIPGELTFQLDTDPATDPPVFTLTCTSTGGPATTVSWSRDGIVVTDNSNYTITSQILVDTETATYAHTLTVTGRLVGEYQCSVSNIRTPSGSRRNLTVVAAGSPTSLNAAQVNLTSFSVSWTRSATVTGYQVYWSGGGGYDSGNMSMGAEDRTVLVTDRIPGLTYNTTIVALSDHLPSLAVGTVMVTLACPQVMDSEYLAGSVVGTFIATTLLYTMILLVSICVLIYWNKRHRTTTDTQVAQLDGAIVMKECDAYGEITITGTDHVYATPHAVN